jgi:ribonuclease BN (tRNA processing enzyme)
MKRKLSGHFTLAFALLFLFGWHGASQAQTKPAPKTQIVMLGTGTPLPDPNRFGPCTAIIVNNTPYLVDLGTGVVRRAAAARDKGVAALEPTNLKIAFITHLHSDHTLGLPDAILTPWVMGRKEPLEVFGPSGTQAMAERILQAYDVDIRARTEGLEHSNASGYKVHVHEISPASSTKMTMSQCARLKHVTEICHLMGTGSIPPIARSRSLVMPLHAAQCWRTATTVMY